MPAVVEAACPGCKKTLRIPANWLGQTMRCKHCGLILATQSPVRAASAVPAPQPAPPLARPIQPPVAPPVARPIGPAIATQQPASSAIASPSVFADLDAEAGVGVRVPRRRRQGGWWKPLVVFFVLLAITGVVLKVAWPQIKELTGPSSTQVAFSEDENRQETKPEKTTQKSDSSVTPSKKLIAKEETPAKTNTRKDVAGKTPPKKDTPRKELPKKDTPRKDPPGNPPAASSLAFPRRALAVSVNNYLYLNPINYGAPDRKSHNVRTLLDCFTSGLRVPTDQVFELSDAAIGKARPPVKALIEKAISDLVATSRPQDRLLLLLVAHTAAIDNEFYLVPIEGDLETKGALIPLSWIYDKLASCPARQKVLILDTCRFDPTRGQERPGGGPMDEKLDVRLKTPPAGVQVWTACTAGQQSYEFDSSSETSVNNGLFLDCLQRALEHGVEGTIQRPEKSIQLDPLVAKVNALMAKELAPLKLKQTSRLSGQEPEGGAAYDPKQPAPAKIDLTMPMTGGEKAAPIEQVRAILKDIEVPPLKLTRDDMLLRAESMPPFAAKKLDEYKEDGNLTPFREAVLNARKALQNQLKGKRLQEEWQMMGDENRHKAFVKEYQEREVARTMRELEEALADLREAGKTGRKEEKSKRWQANYDYILARLEAQVAYLYEYDSALGDMRKDLPEKGPNGWRLASQKKLQGDLAGQRLAGESSKLFEKIAKDHAGTPWEVLAKRARLTNLGLTWQANK
jgi:hypothetical protein